MSSWQTKTIGDLLEYEQPQKYIVGSENYSSGYNTPVLTAGKTFILGYTNENSGIYNNLPVIIFDDFTTAIKYVNFPFKVKSSAMKILKTKAGINIKFIYGWMQVHPYAVGEHKRNYLSEYQYLDVKLPDLSEQNRITSVFDVWDEYLELLGKKIALKERLKKGLMQQLLTGKKRLPGFNDEWVDSSLGKMCGQIRTGKLDASAMVKNGQYRFYTCAKDYYLIDSYAFDTEALLISGNGANVGYVHYYKGKFNAYQRTYVLDEFNTNILFSKFLLDNFLKKRIFEEVREGNMPYITIDTLTDMKSRIPKDVSEQEAIATVLLTAESEISLIYELVNTVKDQKKYLLKNLITGKILTSENLSMKGVN